MLALLYKCRPCVVEKKKKTKKKPGASLKAAENWAVEWGGVEGLESWYKLCISYLGNPTKLKLPARNLLWFEFTLSLSFSRHVDATVGTIRVDVPPKPRVWLLVGETHPKLSSDIMTAVWNGKTVSQSENTNQLIKAILFLKLKTWTSGEETWPASCYWESLSSRRRSEIYLVRSRTRAGGVTFPGILLWQWACVRRRHAQHLPAALPDL